MHARVTAFFDSLKDKWHHVGRDKLNNVDKCYYHSFVEKKALIHRVTRTYVIQRPEIKEKDAVVHVVSANLDVHDEQTRMRIARTLECYRYD